MCGDVFIDLPDEGVCFSCLTGIRFGGGEDRGAGQTACVYSLDDAW